MSLRVEIVGFHASSSLFHRIVLTISSSHPQLFFTSHTTDALHLFSAPQVQNPSLLTASYHMKFPFNDSYGNAGSFDHLRGLTCLTNVWDSNGKGKEMVSMIYNPSTRECLNLPKVKTINDSVRSFLGYNPSANQFKVLCMTWGYCKRHKFFGEIQVLTLGKINRWKRIECSVPHHPMVKRICIDGGLYYHASLAKKPYEDKIVWFDVKYEKFRFIKVVKNPYYWTMVNYKGKLGLLLCDADDREVTRGSKFFELWVLGDAEKHEWSKHVFVLPSSWKYIIGVYDRLSIVGVIAGSDEVVLVPKYQYDRFYVYYYDLERKTIRSVEIQGNDDMVRNSPPYPKAKIFLDHLEDVKLLKMV